MSDPLRPSSPERTRVGGVAALQAALRVTVSETVASALDLIFPPHCVACGKIGALMCPACERTIQPTQDHARHLPPLTEIRAAAHYNGAIRKAIHAFKFDNQSRLAPFLGTRLVAAYQAAGWPATLITAVPLHSTRFAERGYNQSALLADTLARRTRIPFDAHALSRVQDTPHQVGLSARERWLNVEKAFSADPLRVGGQAIILIDDVTTTGATLQRCGVALIDAGAREVWALTVASASFDVSSSSQEDLTDEPRHSNPKHESS